MKIGRGETEKTANRQSSLLIIVRRAKMRACGEALRLSASPMVWISTENEPPSERQHNVSLAAFVNSTHRSKAPSPETTVPVSNL